MPPDSGVPDALGLLVGDEHCILPLLGNMDGSGVVGLVGVRCKVPCKSGSCV